MDDRMKKRLAIEAAPALVPICRAAVSGLYAQKRLDKQHEHEVELAQLRAQKVENPDRPARVSQPSEPDPHAEPHPAAHGERHPEPHDDAAAPPAPAEDAHHDPLSEAASLAEELDRQLEHSLEVENCGWCRDIIAQLREEPLDVQRQGLREMQRLQEVMYSEGTGREEISATMNDLEVVPRLTVEMGER